MNISYCPLCGSTITRQPIDGIYRLACASSRCRYVHWNNPIPVVGALVLIGSEYVLARGAAWPDGLFSLLTGFLEEGESPESAVVREVGEELGLGVKRTDFIGHFPLRELNQLVIAYACHGEGILKPNHEISETRILSRSELVEYDFGPLELTREIVAHWLRMGTRRSRL